MKTNETIPFIEVVTTSNTEDKAQSMRIGLFDDYGILRITIGTTLPSVLIPGTDQNEGEEPRGSEEDEGYQFSTASRLSNVLFGSAVALSTLNPKYAVPLALSLAMFSQAEAQEECITVSAILYLPADVADIYPEEVGKTFTTVGSSSILYNWGQSQVVGTRAACTVDGIAGSCQATSTCGLNTVAGKCPGAANIQCCVNNWGSCTAGGKVGNCQTTTSCSGTKTAGLCPGPANVQCCTSANSPAAPKGYTSPKAGNLGVKMAPMSGIFWPIAGQSNAASRSPICYVDSAGTARQSPTSPVASNFGCSTRRFLASREGGARYHSGVDIYAPRGTRVVATEAGTIVNRYHFYDIVCCVILRTDSGLTINYGEIDCNYLVKVGQRVSAGQVVGTVGDMNCCPAMVHFEIYTSAVTSNQQSRPGKISPALYNPSDYLLALRENGRTG
eukprot:TRINITY_DN1799_c0_g1_i1.p1 TRINITY_DN1799_c0_g1~~TRINITY_DN1799_c0_g1_i1.p1  ORF type:complete len:520 (-),score=138.60 TRINITY_DN1799_c0_g1_i1:60-1391(-)